MLIAFLMAPAAGAGRERDWIERADRQGARLAGIQRRDALAAGLAGGLMTAVTGLTAAAVALVAIPAVRHDELAGVLLAAVILLAMAAFEAVRPLAAAAASIDACAAAGLPRRGRARRAGARRRARRASASLPRTPTCSPARWPRTSRWPTPARRRPTSSTP